MSKSQYSFHADRYGSAFFASLWVDAWGDQYPIEVFPFSSCTYQLLEQLAQQLSLTPNMSLVDMGCGTGGVGLWLAREHEIQVIGIDRCSDAIAIANSRAVEWDLSRQANFVVGDFCNSGLVTASVDAIFSIDAFTATDDIENAFVEIRRVLKPKGDFVFTARELSTSGRHYKTIGSDWKKGLEQYGFQDVRVINRPNVSGLWKSLYSQWLKREAELRKQLCAEAVDALVAEARRGIPLMDDGREWLLIRATVSA